MIVFRVLGCEIMQLPMYQQAEILAEILLCARFRNPD